ncbi:hypothetical protein TNCV_1792781 [Trichonephila clavipes]|nr:hypothetical protein TNCV_1792781 [Trichonephila clavipes]
MHEYRLLKDLQKGSILRIGLRKMIMKFEEIGVLGALPERGWKQVGTETVQQFATAVIETTCCSIYSSASGRLVSASWRFRVDSTKDFVIHFKMVSV